MKKGNRQCHRRLLVIVLLSSLVLLGAGELMAEPFGFFGIRSTLKRDYLEDIGGGEGFFIRANINFSDVYSIAQDVWDFKTLERDNLYSKAYARNAELVLTFMSPVNMDKIRSDYYRDFILRSVERYDGDADYGCTQSPPDCYAPGDQMCPEWIETERPAVKFWQMENEVDANSYWRQNPLYYAELVNLVYPLVKQACPDCTVLLGSFLLKDMGHPFYDVFFQNSSSFDIFDLHRFTGMNKNHFNGYSTRIDWFRQQDPSLPLWMTETSTYTDSPRKADGTFWPYQSELKQALSVFKRYVHFSSLGVEKILWNYLYERTSGKENGIFWYTGLIYDGEGEFDKGKHVKKLSYFTYKLMVQKLAHADWVGIMETNPADNVYQYLFWVGGTPIYVAWYDWFNGTDKSIQVTLDVSAISTAQAHVAKAVPKFRTGKKADTVNFVQAFKTYIVPVTGGTIDITLGKRPVFIEEN